MGAGSSDEVAAEIRASAVKAAMQPLQAKLDKMSKQRQARARSRSRDTSKQEGRSRSRSRSREPPSKHGTEVLNKLGRAVQLVVTTLVCLILFVELLNPEQFDGVVLPGLPNPPGELITLSHGKTHYRLHAPRASATIRRKSANDADVSTEETLPLPVVVCIHGVATYSYVWDPLLERLHSDGAFVLTYDLWGHGHSDGPDAVYDTALYLSQLTQLLASLGLLGGSGDGHDAPPSLVLVGVQYGAVIARQFAAINPHLVAGVMLLESTGAARLADDATKDGMGWHSLVKNGRQLTFRVPTGCCITVTYESWTDDHCRKLQILS